MTNKQPGVLDWLAGDNKPDELGYVAIDSDRWDALRSVAGLLTIPEALAYLRERFDKARAEPMRDRAGAVLACTFKVGRSAFFSPGQAVELARLQLFADGVGYGMRKAEENRERKRRRLEREYAERMSRGGFGHPDR